MKNLMPNK
jgi:hypothetical protein